ncbi:CYFA0S11e03180g1_1 [Cyberlindnera fabianii]|uniref:CYFA0S11e03180g1_1 n=1 Tax=Cyberlindnera fabianii TaxID=36022 RepID=A0A061B6D6_CYBFA|nr:CYFA0S11e03180g1_1 [Cyberlindnera fabianii]
MSLKEEIKQYESLTGVSVDENLYCALMLAMVAKRHVLVTSRDGDVAGYEIGTVLNKFWKFGARRLVVDEIQGSSHADALVQCLTDGVVGILGLVYVIQGVERLDKEAQALLEQVMKTRRVTDKDGQTYVCGELFTVVGVCHEKKVTMLSDYLKLAFWFQQPYLPSYEIHDKPDLFSGQSLTRTSISSDRIRSMLTQLNKIKSITIVPEMKRYIYDIVIFVRTHRCVSTGLPTKTINDLEVLCRTLCVVFEREFVIPTIVKLAARKLIPLKITMISPELEPTLQWGSDPELVREMLKRVKPEIVVEHCLSKVAPPL